MSVHGRSCLAAVALVAVLTAAAEATTPVTVDIGLVIAVDVSASMDRAEFRLQRFGYVEAIRDPDFINAVLSGEYGRIALAYVEWSNSHLHRAVMPWRLIDSAASARAFADELARRDSLTSNGTSISAAIDFAAGLLDASPYDSERRVIDISGDGPNNGGRPVTDARDDAVAGGIVINGLPVLIDPSPVFPAMDRYYRDCVIGGDGSFLLPVYAAEEFGVAIRHKLLMEVTGLARSNVVPVALAQPVDCLVGERARARVDRFLPGLSE